VHAHGGLRLIALIDDDAIVGKVRQWRWGGGRRLSAATQPCFDETTSAPALGSSRVKEEADDGVT